MGNKLSQWLSHLYTSKRLPWIIICIGIILRLIRYLYNTPLFFDEAVSAVNIIDRPFNDLIHSSHDYVSSYPYCFYLFTKLFVQILGSSEYVFRLFPLLLGVASLFLFYYVAKHYISHRVVAAALFFFALLDAPVYYSSILKPYSSDIFFALLIFAALIYYKSKNFSPFSTVIFAVLGAVVIWFSNSSIFVLAGVGGSLMTFGLTKRKWGNTGKFLVVCLIWGLSFFVYYNVFIKSITTNISVSVDEVLKLERAFFPFPPKSLSDIKDLMDIFFDTFNFIDVFGFHQGSALPGVGALLFLSGCISMMSNNREKFVTLISPILFTLLAAALHTYPFKGRLILFLIPFFLLFIAEGINDISEKTGSSRVLITIILLFLFMYPLSWAAYHVIKPLSRGEVKPVLQYVKDNWQNGDMLYVHFYAQYEFEFYSKDHPTPFRFNENEYIIGIAPRGWYRKWRMQDVSKYYDTEKVISQSKTDILKEYIKDLNKLTGQRRVWILFSGNISSVKGISDDDFFLFNLDQKGDMLDSFKKGDAASAYLYDLSMHYKSDI